MKFTDNETVSYYYNPGSPAFKSVSDLCDLIKRDTRIISPSRGDNMQMRDYLLKNYDAPVIDLPGDGDSKVPLFFERKPIASIDRYYIFPTVEKTTLFYDRDADIFIKFLNPINLKNRLLSYFVNKARLVYNLSENLLAKGIEVPKVLAYGMIKDGRKAFLAMERIAGKSLYTMMNIEKQELPMGIYFNVIDKLADLHTLGYWFGDLRIAHVFINGSEISGFVDIDSIKRNIPFRLRNLAKDLAGLNNPELPLNSDEKNRLYQHYLKRMDMKEGGRFLDLIRDFSRKRWK